MQRTVAFAAGLVAGSMSMAAGEYVSVHSQADTENAVLARERKELRSDESGERKELAAIYEGRGLDPVLAKQVAEQLMSHDALDVHARDELGITETLKARPLQVALASAMSFAVGAALPLLVVVCSRYGSGCARARHFIGTSRAARWFGGIRWRREHRGRCAAHLLLGCLRNGGYRRCRQNRRCRNWYG